MDNARRRDPRKLFLHAADPVFEYFDLTTHALNLPPGPLIRTPHSDIPLLRLFLPAPVKSAGIRDTRKRSWFPGPPSHPGILRSRARDHPDTTQPNTDAPGSTSLRPRPIYTAPCIYYLRAPYSLRGPTARAGSRGSSDVHSRGMFRCRSGTLGDRNSFHRASDSAPCLHPRGPWNNPHDCLNSLCHLYLRSSLAKPESHRMAID